MNGNDWIKSKFPESLFPCKTNPQDYYNRVAYGYDLMCNSTAIITGLARDLGPLREYTKARITALGQMFRNYSVILYENDSTDGTTEFLREWYECDHHFRLLISEQLKKARHAQTMEYERTVDMAYYRNRYLSEILENNWGADYLIVVDTDIEGGWSYEGIANSFSYQFDVMASNSLIYKKQANGTHRRLFFDAWAFRKLNHDHPHEQPEINVLRYHRGESPIKVFSAFGGLAIYNMSQLKKYYRYQSGDCDHPTLHKQMRKDGCHIMLNPSQITLYNNTDYVL